MLPRDKIAAEMDVKNQSLNEKLEALQKEILTAGEMSIVLFIKSE